MRLFSLLLLSLALITQYTRSNELRDLNNIANEPNSNYHHSHIKIIEENFEKPPSDDVEYRVIRLPNGVEVVLASDPSTSTAATSAAVRVGSKNDPVDFPGLAHLCEHLLFMGTKKYPREDEYITFINTHGGFFTAYTALERTLYASEIDAKYHFEQIDRLSNFFIEPLFMENLIERETHAVNSEFEIYHSSFSRARFQLFNYVYKDTGYFPTFTTGNRRSLFSNPRAENKNVKQALHNFFKMYYRSYDIKVAIYGNQTLDTLQEWAQKTFGQIPDSGARIQDNVNPFSVINRHHTWYFHQDASPMLDLVFIVPNSNRHYRSIPLHYLNYIFSYPGPNSTSSYFSKGLLASDIDISTIHYSQEFDLIYFSFELDTIGRVLYTEVIEGFFRCINFLKENGLNKEVFDDLVKAQKNAFTYSFKRDPSDIVEDLSESMLVESFPRKYLLNKYYIKEYSKEEFDELFSALNIENFISFMNTKKDFNEIEPNYNTPFRREEYSAPFKQRLKNLSSVNLAYPPKNIYIPTDPKVTMEKLNKTVDRPDILRTTSTSTLWYKYGSFFYCPYGVIRVLLRNPFVSLTSTNVFKLKFLKLYVYMIMSFKTFFTTMAGLDFSVSVGTQGVVLIFNGYGDRIIEIFSKVLSHLERLSISIKQFNRMKSIIFSGFVHRARLPPSAFLEVEAEDLLHSEKTPLNNLLELSSQIDHFVINAFFYDFFASLHFDILVTGDIPPQDALHVLYMLEAVFAPYPITPSQYTFPRAITLEDGSDYFYVQKMPDNQIKSGLLVYFEATEVKDTRKVVLLYLLYIILRNPLYRDLRTREQLAYSLRIEVKVSRTILGFYIVIQSERQPHVLHTRVDAFLSRMLDELNNMTDEEFNYYIEGYNVMFKSKAYGIISETSRIWSNIVEGNYIFDSDDSDEDIGPIKAQHVAELFKEIVYSRRRRISCYAFSPVDADIYNIYDLPLDKISEYLATKGEKVSKDELYEYVLLSHNITSFRTNLAGHLLSKNKNSDIVESMLNDTFQYLKDLYLLETIETVRPFDLIYDVTYFKANSTLSSAFIHASLWNKFY